MTDPIDLQRRADEAMTMLRRDGYRDAADVILALRQWGYDREMRLSAVLAAARGAFPMETER